MFRATIHPPARKDVIVQVDGKPLRRPNGRQPMQSRPMGCGSTTTTASMAAAKFSTHAHKTKGRLSFRSTRPPSPNSFGLPRALVADAGESAVDKRCVARRDGAISVGSLFWGRAIVRSLRAIGFGHMAVFPSMSQRLRETNEPTVQHGFCAISSIIRGGHSSISNASERNEPLCFLELSHPSTNVVTRLSSSSLLARRERMH